MQKKGLSVEIPGRETITVRQALCDVNGTLALDGTLSDAVKERLRRLQALIPVYLVTADTHGTADNLVQECGQLEIARIKPGKEAEQKVELLKNLGAWQTIAFGNGANDALMLRNACVGICIMNGEGTAVQAIMASDILVRSAEEALDLLLQPARLIATLRC